MLNILGYMPGISSASGTTRVLYGIIETVAGLAAGLFLGLANRVIHYPQGSYRAMKQLSYAAHGSENIFRGIVELLPFVVNILALIAYDLTITRHEYDAEGRERLSMRHKV